MRTIIGFIAIGAVAFCVLFGFIFTDFRASGASQALCLRSMTGVVL